MIKIRRWIKNKIFYGKAGQFVDLNPEKQPHDIFGMNI